MAQIKVVHDQQGNTLTVWFGNPQDEVVAEETGDTPAEPVFGQRQAVLRRLSETCL